MFRHAPTNMLIAMKPYVSGGEDFLTEALAATLRADALFAERFSRILLGDRYQPKLVAVYTQVVADRDRPDMLLEFENGDWVLIENKLEAAETKQEQDDGTVVEQLIRYLALAEKEGFLGVAYIRENTTPKGVAGDVLNHPRYIRPETNQHFLWRHFFEAFPANASPVSLTGMLRGYFEYCGYTQPLPTVGSMSAPENQLNFAKLLEPTLAAVRSAGWTNVSVNKFAELYAEGHASGIGLLVSPNRADGTRLLVRLSPWPTESEAIRQELAKIPNVVSASCTRLQRSKGPTVALDLLLDLNALLKDLHAADEIANRISAEVNRIVAVVFPVT